MTEAFGEDFQSMDMYKKIGNSRSYVKVECRSYQSRVKSPMGRPRLLRALNIENDICIEMRQK